MLRHTLNNYIETVSKGNTYIPNNYLFDNNISDGMKTLLTILQASSFGDKVETYPAQKTLAIALNKSVRTIQRYIKKLKELGYITVKRRGSLSNVYTILIKIKQQTAEKATKAIREKINNIKNNNNYKKNERPDFNDYDQRSYNYSNLEAMLLGNMDYNPELLYKP